MNIFYEFPVLIPLAAGFLAEGLKVLIIKLRHKTVTKGDFFRSGGMPSGHSSFAAALAITMLQLYGAHSAEFTLAAAFAIVVVVDAIKFRRAAGLHAAALNKLTKDNKLDERLGHNPVEVSAGVVFGSVLALLLLSF